MKGYTGKKISYNWFDYLNVVFMCIMCISVLFPFWDMFMRSLSTAAGSSKLQFVLWPNELSFDSYRFILKDSKVINAYSITIARTITGTVLSLILVMLAAYPLSKKDLPFRNIITIILIIPMFFSGGLMPSYILNRQLDLVNNFLVYILPGAVGIYNVVLTRNYLMSLDKSLEESAFIDGAGYLTILTRIIIPLSKPILVTIALWVAVGQWNAWFDSLIYARSESLVVMQLLLRRMLDTTTLMSEEMKMFMELENAEEVTSNTVRMATTIITVLPIMMVYPFIQKYFIKGIMVGSLKG